VATEQFAEKLVHPSTCVVLLDFLFACFLLFLSHPEIRTGVHQFNPYMGSSLWVSLAAPDHFRFAGPFGRRVHQFNLGAIRDPGFEEEHAAVGVNGFRLDSFLVLIAFAVIPFEF